MISTIAAAARRQCLVSLFAAAAALSTAPVWAEGAADAARATTNVEVRPLAAPLFAPAASDESQAAVLQAYFESIRDWGAIVHGQVQPLPDNPTMRYVGLPRNVENDVRATAYAAMVLSFLAEAGPPGECLDDALRTTYRDDAIALLRYVAQAHVACGGACLNGKPWGDQWQSALWARAVCFAGWQLWPHLDDNLKQNVVRVLEHEADRFVRQAPKSSVRDDTGAEENAWNASICALACNMLVGHPRADAWESAAKRYMYNTFSVRADANDASPADDGLAVRDWVTTVNAHDDFTVENHRLVHVGYLKNSACMLQENAVHWLLAERAPPRAAAHHVPEVFRVLAGCMDWNGSAIYFAGNDWRLYETQCSDVLLYCMLGLLDQNREAVYLERVALERLREAQQHEGGYYNGRRDLEYGGLCATRLITCYFVHASQKTPLAASTADEFDAAAGGVQFLRSAKAVLHRTKSKFASFTWAQQRMGLTMASERHVVWPHYASYLGLINGEIPSERHARLAAVRMDEKSDSFSVTGRLVRCGGTLTQDFYFASPAGDYTVYVERLQSGEGIVLGSRETGLIGLHYEPGCNEHRLTGDFGLHLLQGTGGDEGTREFASRWLNVDDVIGYVVVRPCNETNTMRLHDYSSFEPRRPHLQESISLIGDESGTDAMSPQWACVVTFVNADASQTEASLATVDLQVDGDRAEVRVGDDRFEIDFAN